MSWSRQIQSSIACPESSGEHMNITQNQPSPALIAEAEHAINRCITKVISGSTGSPHRVFYASLIMRLQLECCFFIGNTELKTMATDSVKLFFNPNFVLGLSEEELVFCIVHEAEHCARLHCFRREDRDSELWNIACDLHVNRDEVEAGFTPPKIQIVNDPSLCKRSEEETYYYLEQDAKALQKAMQAMQGAQGKLGEMGIGGTIDAPSKDAGGNPVDQGEAKRKWITAVQESAMLAKGAGTLPGSIEGYIKANAAPKIRWQDQLREFVSGSTVVTDRTYSRPNRRFIPHGLYVPSDLRDGGGTVVVFLDTSGSVGMEAHKQFASELAGIHDDIRPERLMFVYVDTQIQRVLDYGPEDDIETPYVGGGGTYFQPAFDYLKKEGIVPDCAIYLTDMEPADTPVEPNYPVLWVSIEDRIKPWFGKKIYLDLSQR